jgi:signal transduction histidine kinase
MREEGIALDLALAEPAPRVRGDEALLREVVANLLSNARIACAGLEDRRVVLSTRAAGDDAVLAVSDDGRGIAPEALPRVFEPFFTTKAVPTSAGLGLAVASAIVAGHGGRMTADSAPGRGSRFTVALPRAPGAPRGAAVT